MTTNVISRHFKDAVHFKQITNQFIVIQSRSNQIQFIKFQISPIYTYASSKSWRVSLGRGMIRFLTLTWCLCEASSDKWKTMDGWIALRRAPFQTNWDSSKLVECHFLSNFLVVCFKVRRCYLYPGASLFWRMNFSEGQHFPMLYIGLSDKTITTAIEE